MNGVDLRRKPLRLSKLSDQGLHQLRPAPVPVAAENHGLRRKPVLGIQQRP